MANPAWLAPAIGAGLGGLLGLAGRDSAKTVATTNRGSSSSAQQGQSSWSPHPYAQPFYGFAAEQGNYLAQNPVPFFPGPTYVGPSAPTQLGVGYGMDAIPTMQAGLGIAGNNYSFLSGAADIQNNPYVQGQLSANQSAVQDLLNTNLAQGAGAAASGGMLGSSADALMRGKALGDAAEALSRTNASTMLNAYGQGLRAQQGALGQTGAMLNNLMAPSQAALGMGQRVEDYQGRALDDAMTRFAYQYLEPQQRLGLVQGLAQMFNPMGTTYTSGTRYGAQSGVGTAPNQNYQSPLQAILGGASAGAGIGSYF